MNELEEKILAERWFYRFPLPSGRETEMFSPGRTSSDDRHSFHATRLQMLMVAVDALAQEGKLPENAVDLGCHQGWFSFHIAQRGSSRVLGLDARPEHVEMADWIKQAHGLDGLSYKVADMETLKPDVLGRFDLVLMLGLIYHLENPLAALRKARALCNGTLVIETQVVPHLSGRIDWGSYLHAKDIQGVFGIVDENEAKFHSDGVTGLALVPSCEGLMWLLGRLGFATVTLLTPPHDAHEQLLTGKRVMIAAHLD